MLNSYFERISQEIAYINAQGWNRFARGCRRHRAIEETDAAVPCKNAHRPCAL